MSSIVISGDTSGAVTVAVPAVAGTNTVTIAAQTGTLNAAGPAFSAYLGSNQNITASTRTKLQINTEEFDTNNNFDSTTNYRFTPTVAGYYQVNAVLVTASASTQCNAAIYKNGSLFKDAQFIGTYTGATVSSIVYFNGSTDYIEFYGFLAGVTPTVQSGASNTYFSAALVRGA